MLAALPDERTILLAVSAAFAGLLAGTFIAIALWRAPKQVRTIGTAAAAIFLLMPNGVAADLIGRPALLWAGPVALMAAWHAGQGAAITLLFTSIALQRLNPGIMRAAAACGAGPITAIRTVVLPPIAPALCIAWFGALALALS